ncbi:MAG: ABC transporter permease [Prevotellaceae bacterium]|nr:ABC transporter permease [Candidatus Colivivens equi]MCQ2075555.1 ABC transporter permease [Bacteroidaceae bacterium]
MNLVWKLLRQHISIPQFAGFFLANLVGMLIIMLGVQFYNDTQAIYNGEDSFMRNDYFIINKTIGTISGITGKSETFTEDEINELKSQPFVKKMGWFTSSAFQVRASFNIEDFSSFSTEMFFESVPDEFVDVMSEKWFFEEDNTDIPIILPRNYLDLYNFGYAQSQNLPQLSEGLFGAISLDITISGNGETGKFHGNIVGFSSRLNTILVPEQFMKWANDKYGSTDVSSTISRIIMEVDNPADENITQYLQDNNYETDQSKLDASKTTFLLKMIVGIVTSVGLVICILAFYILMLSVLLLVEKNNTKLENLLVIGYSPAKVAMPYQLLTIGLNITVLILSSILLIIIRNEYINLFENFFPNMDIPSLWQSLVAGTILLVIVSILNIIAIRTKIMSIWKKKD